MEANILTQQKKSERRIFTVDATGLMIHVQNDLGESHRHVSFENISNDIVKINFNPVFWIIVVVSAVLLFISGLFIKMYGVEGEGQIYRYAIPFLIGGVVTLFFTISSEMTIKCYNQPAIEFFKNLPSQKAIDEFVEALFMTRNRVLIKKYGFVSEFISYKDQIDKFSLLHSLGIISMDEFEKLKEELDELGESRSGYEIHNLN